jgi:hypothetical protein
MSRVWVGAVLVLVLVLVGGEAVAEAPALVQPSFSGLERRDDAETTYKLNAFDIVHVESTEIGVIWNSTTTWWRVSRGAYRHPTTYVDFYQALGRPDLADQHESRNDLSNVLFWGGAACMLVGVVGGGYELYKGEKVGAIIGAGLLVGGYVSVRIGASLSGPAISEEVAQDLASRYNQALGRHLGVSVGGSL